ncbi:hypothetical protein F3Y22_tig00111584pilonHSYRG00181 [Hibiscus syriacus]|uniref:Spatacsin C-terminal domain-containing protein n=1 Tax=Hibiscus syriacus TaxID=106335 RepID=A0A6A2XJZ6_HIBSY|nr:hypothetical protein F3Y22_tig00111584pilonHSYRG00181 [Hibiscus syriacus]
MMVHAFSWPDKSCVPGTMLEGESKDGTWVEWGPSSSSFQHTKEEKPIDLSFEASQSTIDKTISNGNLGVPDKISEKVGDDVLLGTGSSKRWLRSFFTKAETVEYEGGIWTRFPQKPSFPCSANVVSFVLFTRNFPVSRFLCKNNSTSRGNSCRGTIRNLENGSRENVELDTFDVGSSTPYKCSRVLSCNSHKLIGFFLTRMNSASSNASNGKEKRSKNIIVIARLDIRGIQWVSLVKLPQNENTCPLDDWKDFHFSDDVLICLNASGLVFFYDTVSDKYYAFEKLLPHYQHLGLGMLIGWDVGSSDWFSLLFWFHQISYPLRPLVIKNQALVLALDVKHETASLLESRAEKASMQWFECYDREKIEDLLESMRYYIEAAEVLSSIDAGNKTRRACAQASLVSLQRQIPDSKWLHLSETNARRALVEESRFQEALIVAEAYGLNQPTEWALSFGIRCSIQN